MENTKSRMLFGMFFALILIFVLPKEEIFYGYIPVGAIPMAIKETGVLTTPSQITVPVVVGNDTIFSIMYKSLYTQVSKKQRFVKGYKRDNLSYIDRIRDTPFLRQIK